MNGHLEYEAVLKGQIGSSVFVLVMIFILSVVLVVLNLEVFKTELSKIARTLVNAFLVVVICSATVVFVTRIYNIKQDIKSQSYVTYCGEFSVSEYRDGYVTFKEQDEKITLSGRCELPGGEYVGTIIYSKSSKHLLDWEVDD